MYADSTTAETTTETTTDGFDADELRLALEASTKETSADVLAVDHANVAGAVDLGGGVDLEPAASADAAAAHVLLLDAALLSLPEEDAAVRGEDGILAEVISFGRQQAHRR